MERRVLIAITLSFLVLFLFQRFVMPPPAPPRTSLNVTAGQPPRAPVAPGPAPSPTPQAPSPQVRRAGAGECNTGRTSDDGWRCERPRDRRRDHARCRAVFSNRGAKIVHWILKEFRNDAGEPLDLVPGEGILPPGMGDNRSRRSSSPWTIRRRARASTRRSIASR